MPAPPPVTIAILPVRGVSLISLLRFAPQRDRDKLPGRAYRLSVFGTTRLSQSNRFAKHSRDLRSVARNVHSVRPRAHWCPALMETIVRKMLSTIRGASPSE